MTEKQEIRVKAIELTFEFFKMIKVTKILPRTPEIPDTELDSKKPIEGDLLFDGIFAIAEKFETFILKALDEQRG